MQDKEESKPLLCLPGQRLCLSDESTIAGQGTYERQGYIYATVMGSVSIREKDNVSFRLNLRNPSYFASVLVQVHRSEVLRTTNDSSSPRRRCDSSNSPSKSKVRQMLDNFHR